MRMEINLNARGHFCENQMCPRYNVTDQVKTIAATERVGDVTIERVIERHRFLPRGGGEVFLCSVCNTAVKITRDIA